MQDVILPDGRVFRFDDDSGSWRHVPDVATANAMGVDFGNLDAEDSLPGPEGPEYPSVNGDGGGGGGGGGGGEQAPPAGSTSSLVQAGYPELVRTPDQKVWILDNGVYRWIPDPETLAALRLNVGSIVNVDATPLPQGADLPSVNASSSTAAVASAASAPAGTPTVSTPAAAAESAQTFTWGGINWGRGDLTAFIGYLAAHGVDYSSWALNHPAAAELLEGPPVDPAMERVPKSIGEALGAAIAAGDSPEDAAKTVAALAAAQRAQGFGAPSDAELVDAAQQVADAFAAAGGSSASAQAHAASDANAQDVRQLLSFVSPEPLAGLPSPYRPAGIAAAWRAMLSVFSTSVPQSKRDVDAEGNRIMAIFK